MRLLFTPSSAPIRPVRLSLTLELRRALLLSQVCAVCWWGVALWISSLNLVPVWYDQRVTFTQVPGHLGDPYTLPNFIYPPWTVILLWPFGHLSLPLATLAQTCLYFALLTLVIFKFGGGGRISLLALTSFIAFLTAIEMNIEWLSCLGLLLPPLLSGPFLLIKPQNALGVWLSFTRRDLVRAVIVTLVVVLVTFILWDASWPLRAWARIQQITLGTSFNMAPLALLPWPLALAVGLWLGWRAFRHRDPVLSILAWLFFVPYIAPYSLLLPFSLMAIRYPRIVLLISGLLWLVYGGILALGLLLTR